MSLLYWLPLDSQTNNLGLKKLTWLAGNFYNGIGVTTANCYKTIDNRGFNTPCVNLGLNFTVCFWVKNTDLTYPRTCIAMKQSSGSPYSVGAANKGWDIGHGQNGNSVQVTLNDGVISQRLTITPPAGFGPLALLNTWYHASYVIDYDNKLISYYVNGELMGTKAISASMGDYSTNKNFYFGNLYGWQFYGELNDFRIYDEALSAGEIQNIAGGLFSHYDCQDQFPSSVIYDSSGYSRNATAEINLMPDIVQDSGSGDMSFSFDTTSKYLELPQNLKHITSGTLSYWWRSSAFSLPDDYQEVEYIRANGTQYIDTGIKGNMSYKYKIIFKQISASSYRIWGVFNQSSYQGRNMSLTYVSGTPGTWAIRWESRTSGQVYVALPTININKHELFIDNGYVYFDGTSHGRSAYHSEGFEFDYNLYLFTINPGGTAPTTSLQGDIFEYKVWDSDNNLIQYLVPCYRKSDGVVGMYDLVGQNFKINIGTGVFTKGPDGSQVENSVFLTDGICYLMKTTTGATTFSHKLSSGGAITTNLPIYVDGELTNSVPVDREWHHVVCKEIDLSAFGSTLTIGPNLIGRITDIRFYNSLLSPNYIKNLYEAKAKITKGRKALAHYFVENNLADTSIKKSGSWNWSYFYEPKILEDGSKWKLLFYHKNHGGTVLFSNANGWAEAKKSATPDKFSILGDLDSTYQKEGKFEFLLRFPNNTTFQNGFNRWKQSSNPTTSAVSGYEAIDISWTSNLWGGLEYNGNQALMDGSVNSSNWFYAIGARTAWGGAIPGPSSAVEETELWVRVDRTAHENDWGFDARNLTVEEIIEF